MIEEKLKKSDIENILSLTSLQKGILFHYINDEYSNMYHEQLSLSIKGDLKVGLFQKSVQLLIENNEMLRTVFRWKNIDNPIQIILKKHEIPLKYMDFTKEINKEVAIENLKSNDLNNKIDITKETLRIYICKLDDCTHNIIISNHHILYDGWSNGIILNELITTYTCLYNNKEVKKNHKTKFSEFIKYLNNINKNNEKDYWENYLQGLENKNDCFYCKRTGNYETISYEISENNANKIKDFAKNNKVLLSSIFYGAWSILLQIFCNSNEVLFGTTVSGRPESIQAVDNMVGLFINTIPIKVTSNDNTTFLEIIHYLDKILNERKEFENTSLVDIKKYCGLKGNEELFNSIVTIENYPLDLDINKNNILSIENFSIVEKTNYNMSVEIMTFYGIEFKFTYNNLSIDNNLAHKLGIYMEKIISSLINDIDIKISEIELITEEEKGKLLYEFNNTKTSYPKNKTIHEIFEDKAAKFPEKVAAVFENNKITYKELNEKSNYIAKELRNKGIKSDSIVGIMVERSLEMLIGILAVLKSGGAYIPISPNSPHERIEYIVKDSNLELILTTKNLIEYIDTNIECMELENAADIINESNNLNLINNSENLAYIIYTSGSTGKPKGVAIEHRNVVNTLTCMENNYPTMDNDAWLLKTSYTFDVSVTELFGWFIGQGCLAILKEGEEKDIHAIIDAIDKYNVTHINFIPSMLDIFNEILEYKLNKIHSLKYVFSAGEALKANIAKQFLLKTKNIRLENIYGPTETTIYVLKHSVDKNFDYTNIPIGKPFDNTKVYILNKNNNLVPIGVAGELCVSGDSVARYYINKLELTNEKFIDNPFENGTKIYKTGDLAKWLDNGDVEFIGRKDNQIKIRGFRVELGEIENTILQHESIKYTVVVDKEDSNGNKFICAYIISEQEINELKLKSYIKEILPEYMIPDYFIKLDKMPLTTNGKLDKKLLPEPQINIDSKKHETPKSEIEKDLLNIWSEILEVKNIGINDNFFDIGGNSISALRIINKVRSKLKLDVSIKFLFQNPNIKIFCQEILKLKNSELIEFYNVSDLEYYPLSYNQKRLWLINKLNESSNAFNIIGTINIKSQTSQEIIKKCFKNLIERHESLRTGFNIIDEEITQFIINVEEIPFEYVDILSEDDKTKDNIKTKYINEYRCINFDLSNPPLIKIMLIKLNHNNYELIVSMHHIISDGWSLEILKKELYQMIEAYSKNEIPVLKDIKFRYRDFVAWENNIINNHTLKMRALEFWKEKFKNGMPISKIPYDCVSNETNEGAAYVCFIEYKLKNQIKKFVVEFYLFSLSCG